jgi:hypothetical protein
MAAILGLQAAALILTVKDIEDLLAPYRQAYRPATSAPPVLLVFLSGDVPEFTAKHVNWNDADWWKSPIIYLNAPGPDRRREIACRFGKPSYRVIQYLPESRAFLKDDALAACTPAPPLLGNLPACPRAGN